ncbi:phosphate-starvation-inducible PsiE family protein [Litorisediminicola beolgyonensis]|uniref:Phosphate-starvation-inducible PsiE family protein n=1 Tax=Litorisediminicola beolgyonensis TaxID=1173614 RepID=A0ABW3ZFD9_9RHOB
MKDAFDRLYHHATALVAVLLLLGTMAVIGLATASFLRLTFQVAAESGLSVSYTTLQALFDLLLGAVIAIELAHSVHLMLSGGSIYAQVRIVLVIGLLAVVRKLIVVELEAVSGALLLGLAAAVLALGIAFAILVWIERETDTG